MSEQDANLNVPTWLHDGQSFPLFAFDEPQVVKLPNGTSHHFKKWSPAIEKKREDSLKTVIITSPHLINGENPRDVKTDFTRSLLSYYSLMIDRISGVSFEGFEETSFDANAETGETFAGDPERKVRFVDLIGAPIRKAAAQRLYGGKIEIEKPDTDEGDETNYDDPFGMDEAELDIAAEIAKVETQKELYKLTLDRKFVVRQELGRETVNGRETPPVNIIRYHLREPNGDDFALWELKGYRGFAVSLNKGGERAERYYNLDTVNTLFNRLIDQIEGASINGSEFTLASDRSNASRIALLEQVPLGIKKMVVAVFFAEMQSLGNS